MVGSALRKLRDRVSPPPYPMFDPDCLIAKIARFVCAEMIAGDYYEFGVYQGNSLLAALLHIEKAFYDRILTTVDNQSDREREQRLSVWRDMRFFAFDSFQGLPELTGPDRNTNDFRQGQYASTLTSLRDRLDRSGLRSEKVVPVEGWFDDTCTDETKASLKMNRASVVMIDSDLYASARTALDFITPAIQDGTVIIFDDWYSYRGHPDLGEQRAFHEWMDANPRFSFTEYQNEGAWRKSFIINLPVDDA
jgi:hypothetical protein